MDLTNEVLQIAKRYLRRVSSSGPENIMALCPFHRKADGSLESDPSFALSLTKGLYYCHGCHASGSLRKFLREVGELGDNLDILYGELLNELGKNLPPKGSKIQPKAIFDQSPMDDSFLGLFDYDVRPFMPGFSLETLKYFDVGWDGWYHRVTFPIRDIQGRLVGISGRATEEDQYPRYKIYDDEYLCWAMPKRENVLHKRGILWNLHNVYPRVLLSPAQALTNEKVVVVEGFKAAMWLWQAGVTNVVALLGSYMSEDQQWMLEAIGCAVYLFLDNNKAGRHGQLNAAKRLLEAESIRGGEIHVVQYPERLAMTEAQPDALTVSEVLDQLAGAPTYVKWKLEQERRHGIW